MGPWRAKERTLSTTPLTSHKVRRAAPHVMFARGRRVKVFVAVDLLPLTLSLTRGRFQRSGTSG